MFMVDALHPLLTNAVDLQLSLTKVLLQSITCHSSSTSLHDMIVS